MTNICDAQDIDERQQKIIVKLQIKIIIHKKLAQQFGISKPSFLSVEKSSEAVLRKRRVADHITLLFSSSITSFAYPAAIHAGARHCWKNIDFWTIYSIYADCTPSSAGRKIVSTGTREGIIYFHKELEGASGMSQSILQLDNSAMIWHLLERQINVYHHYHHYQITWTYFCCCKRHQTIVEVSSCPLICRCQIAKRASYVWLSLFLVFYDDFLLSFIYILSNSSICYNVKHYI